MSRKKALRRRRICSHTICRQFAAWLAPEGARPRPVELDPAVCQADPFHHFNLFPSAESQATSPVAGVDGSAAQAAFEAFETGRKPAAQIKRLAVHALDFPLPEKALALARGAGKSGHAGNGHQAVPGNESVTKL